MIDGSRGAEGLHIPADYLCIIISQRSWAQETESPLPLHM